MIASLYRSIGRRFWLWSNRTAFARTQDTALPQLLVDVSTIIRFDAQTGIQRVVRAVWSELLRRNGDGFELRAVFATPTRGYCFAPLSALDQGGPTVAFEPAAAGPNDRFLGLDLVAQHLPNYREQLRRWKAAGATVNLVVYDLLPLARPEWFSDTGARNFRRWFSLLTSEADGAICISRDVADDLHRRLAQARPVNAPRIRRIQLGGDIENSLPSSGNDLRVAELLERIRSRPTVLMVGTIEPRKGYDIALAAFDQLWASQDEQAPDLVIVGKPGWKTEELQQQILKHPEFGRRLHWLARVSDEDLCRLYSASRAFFMPSRGEGMGLPLLEAAMHGCHILARDLPVFREQGLAHVQYFDDDRPEMLAAALRALAVRSERPAPSQEGLPTWADTVDQLLQALDLQAGEEAAPLSLGGIAQP